MQEDNAGVRTMCSSPRMMSPDNTVKTNARLLEVSAVHNF